jgi:septal ring factor EnvC (AmiA/AmiB activator)
LGNFGAIFLFAKNTSFAPGSASGFPAVRSGTLAPATPAFASGGYSSAAPGSVLARLQAKWRQEAENKRQKNKEAKEKKEKFKAELKRKTEKIEQVHKLAKKEKKDEKKKKKMTAEKNKAAQKREIKKIKREEIRLRYKAKIQH